MIDKFIIVFKRYPNQYHSIMGCIVSRSKCGLALHDARSGLYRIFCQNKECKVLSTTVTLKKLRITSSNSNKHYCVDNFLIEACSRFVSHCRTIVQLQNRYTVTIIANHSYRPGLRLFGSDII